MQEIRMKDMRDEEGTGSVITELETVGSILLPSIKCSFGRVFLKTLTYTTTILKP